MRNFEEDLFHKRLQTVAPELDPLFVNLEVFTLNRTVNCFTMKELLDTFP